jgi:hypothetical protein
MECKKIDFKTALILKELKFDIKTKDFLRLDSIKIINFSKQDYNLTFGELLLKNNKDLSCFLYSSEARFIHFLEEKDPFFMYHPTQSLVQKWLREKHKLFICVKHKITGSVEEPIIEFTYNGNDGEWNNKFYPTYEDALEIALVEYLQRVSKTSA